MFFFLVLLLHNSAMDDTIVSHRRTRLNELATKVFANQADLIRFAAEEFDVHLNQGELSALRKAEGKSFREVKARNLETQLRLLPGWLDMPLGASLDKPPHYMTASSRTPPYNSPAYRDEESLLLRAFRAADPAVRLAWLDQARGIVERIHTPSPLNGTDLSTTG